eukprot:CAMPEP_0183320284 /NCGR_PEP_ID=MMETSP0160_2-20130417/65865_1 /TAXON_ID=2839 ORGANISM="Odontella Sinensis, Strain Grunow 1884" /NCGR_SAMPLE_ID=MMETSP0160_2 /ASSEMBLY_ACC=CAM_ASM_000250 /LENGTH=249 /DNA_ID=CAMNT_0025486949 /DNA_START=79 /DNA_END=828 /DNA_ORIENTATION=+
MTAVELTSTVNADSVPEPSLPRASSRRSFSPLVRTEAPLGAASSPSLSFEDEADDDEEGVAAVLRTWAKKRKRVALPTSTTPPKGDRSASLPPLGPARKVRRPGGLELNVANAPSVGLDGPPRPRVPFSSSPWTDRRMPMRLSSSNAQRVVAPQVKGEAPQVTRGLFRVSGDTATRASIFQEREGNGMRSTLSESGNDGSMVSLAHCWINDNEEQFEGFIPSIAHSMAYDEDDLLVGLAFVSFDEEDQQ